MNKLRQKLSNLTQKDECFVPRIAYFNGAMNENSKQNIFHNILELLAGFRGILRIASHYNSGLKKNGKFLNL